jgi:hypothetical protein
MRIPAMAASAAPTVQVTVASTSGDQPSADAARSFSAAAVIARPSRVRRQARPSTAVSATAMRNK